MAAVRPLRIASWLCTLLATSYSELMPVTAPGSGSTSGRTVTNSTDAEVDADHTRTVPLDGREFYEVPELVTLAVSILRELLMDRLVPEELHLITQYVFLCPYQRIASRSSDASGNPASSPASNSRRSTGSHMPSVRNQLVELLLDVLVTLDQQQRSSSAGPAGRQRAARAFQIFADLLSFRFIFALLHGQKTTASSVLSGADRTGPSANMGAGGMPVDVSSAAAPAAGTSGPPTDFTAALSGASLPDLAKAGAIDLSSDDFHRDPHTAILALRLLAVMLSDPTLLGKFRALPTTVQEEGLPGGFSPLSHLLVPYMAMVEVYSLLFGMLVGRRVLESTPTHRQSEVCGVLEVDESLPLEVRPVQSRLHKMFAPPAALSAADRVRSILDGSALTADWSLRATLEAEAAALIAVAQNRVLPANLGIFTPLYAWRVPSRLHSPDLTFTPHGQQPASGVPAAGAAGGSTPGFFARAASHRVLPLTGLNSSSTGSGNASPASSTSSTHTPHTSGASREFYTPLVPSSRKLPGPQAAPPATSTHVESGLTAVPAERAYSVGVPLPLPRTGHAQPHVGTGKSGAAVPIKCCASSLADRFRLAMFVARCCPERNAYRALWSSLITLSSSALPSSASTPSMGKQSDSASTTGVVERDRDSVTSSDVDGASVSSTATAGEVAVAIPEVMFIIGVLLEHTAAISTQLDTEASSLLNSQAFGFDAVSPKSGSAALPVAGEYEHLPLLLNHLTLVQHGVLSSLMLLFDSSSAFRTACTKTYHTVFLRQMVQLLVRCANSNAQLKVELLRSFSPGLIPPGTLASGSSGGAASAVSFHKSLMFSRSARASPITASLRPSSPDVERGPPSSGGLDSPQPPVARPSAQAPPASALLLAPTPKRVGAPGTTRRVGAGAVLAGPDLDDDAAVGLQPQAGSTPTGRLTPASSTAGGASGRSLGPAVSTSAPTPFASPVQAAHAVMARDFAMRTPSPSPSVGTAGAASADTRAGGTPTPDDAASSTTVQRVRAVTNADLFSTSTAGTTTSGSVTRQPRGSSARLLFTPLNCAFDNSFGIAQLTMDFLLSALVHNVIGSQKGASLVETALGLAAGLSVVPSSVDVAANGVPPGRFIVQSALVGCSTRQRIALHSEVLRHLLHRFAASLNERMLVESSSHLSLNFTSLCQYALQKINEVNDT